MNRLLVAADNTLKSADEAGNKTSKVVDNKFKRAFRLLSDLEKDFPFKDRNITVTGEEKTSNKSKSPSKILYALKKNLHAKVSLHMFRYVSALMNPSPWAVKSRN